MPGNLDRAIQCFEKALALAPQDTDALNNLAVAYLNKGENTKAINRLKQCLNINPHYGGAYLNLSVAYYRIGRLDKAEEAARQAVDMFEKPDLQAQAYYNLGFLLDDRERFPEALEAFDQAVELGLAAKGRLGRAVAKAHQGHLEEGIRELQELKESWSHSETPSPASRKLGPLVDRNLELMQQELARQKREKLQRWLTFWGKPLSYWGRILLILLYGLMAFVLFVQQREKAAGIVLIEIIAIWMILHRLASREPSTTLFCLAALIFGLIQKAFLPRS